MSSGSFKNVSTKWVYKSFGIYVKTEIDIK